MTIYLVLSALTSSPISLVAATKASAFSFRVCFKMDLQEAGRGRGDWMELAQDREWWRELVGTVRNFRVP